MDTHSSSNLPTLHLLGLGPVGRALLGLLDAAPLRLLAVSDSSGTVNLDRGPSRSATEIVAHKRRAGSRLADLGGALRISTVDAVSEVGADFVVDAMATDLGDVDVPTAVVDAVLARGGRVALASKAALCRNVDRWLAADLRDRVGIDAVLGGTGAALARDLHRLRAEVVTASLCGSASTIHILECIESGGTFEQGLEVAARAGCLESDPELDLRGEDAAVKLAIVAGALSGAVVEPVSIERPDLRELDFELVRARAQRGVTTRLVGRFDRDSGARTLRFEELERSDPLVAPPNRVVYRYVSRGGNADSHFGHGVGAIGTASALLGDLRTFCRG